MQRREFESRPPLPGAGTLPDYTTPFLVIASVLTFLGLIFLWAVWGYPVALLVAFVADRALAQA